MVRYHLIGQIQQAGEVVGYRVFDAKTWKTGDIAIEALHRAFASGASRQ